MKENNLINKDIFGKETDILRDKKLFLFDMDGTIYEDDKLYDGALELLNLIKENGGRYIFITNNSSKSVKDYIDKVNKLGIEATEDNFFTSTQATSRYLNERFSQKKIYCQGTDSFIQELKNFGLNIVTEVTEEADAIVVGFDTELSSEKIRNTCEMIVKGLPYIATNPDLVCPVNFGFIPDCGSICQMYENATGKNPIFIGKPSAKMVEFVIDKFNCNREDTVVIGDRLYTDIQSGVNARVDTICVLTGEATIEQINNYKVQPTFTFDSVKNILEVL